MLTYYHKTAHQSFETNDAKPKNAWLSVVRPTSSECGQLIKAFSLDPKTIRDVGDSNELPRYEHKRGIHYVFLRTAARTPHGQIVTAPLLAIATAETFLTISLKETSVVDDVLEYGKEYELTTADQMRMLTATMAVVVDQYQQIIAQTGGRILDIKRRLQHHEVSNNDFIKFVTIEDNLNEYGSYLNETRSLCERLMVNDKWQFSGEALEDLDDIRLHIQQLLNEVSRHAQSITSIRNAYGTISNNTLNQRMKTLTVFTVLITIPNVFYGMYGMNVGLPFQKEPWAYGLIVLLSLSVVGAVYYIAKRFRAF